MNTRFIVKAVAAIALTMFAFAACDKDRKDPKDPGGKEQPIEEVTPGLSVTASYYGDYLGNHFLDYVLVFVIGETDADGYFVHGGKKLSLDILTSETAGGPTLFPAGIYEITNANHNSVGIMPTPESEDDETCTFFYDEMDASNYWNLAVDSARLEVESNGGQYTIKVDFTSDGDTFSWLYKGSLPIVDYSNTNNGSGEGPDGDYDFKADCAYAYNLGRSWDDPADPNDTDDWELEFYNSKNDNEWMSVEIVAPAASNIADLPTGNFVIPASFDDHPAAGSLLPPYVWNEVWCGTFYGFGEEVWYVACSGSLKISKSGDDYTFELSFRDDGYEDEEYGYDPARVTMTYTGKVEVDVSEYWDGTDDEEDYMFNMKKAGPTAKVKMARRNSVKRQSKAALKAAGRR
ncbi:MAG: hypothetical protein J5748_01170 [Bacteroidales bacterium]|nr:hypothetical protein [Bacteroidales bacterium]